MSMSGYNKAVSAKGFEIASMVSDSPSVACVILNWNGWRDSIECLAAIFEVNYPLLSVTVVDNGSTDGSVERIRTAYPGVAVIETGENLGFSAGNNVAIRQVMARNFDYVWVLNNDTVPRKDALMEMVRKAESDKQLGAVGSVLLYADNPNVVQAWGGGKVNVWTGRGSFAFGPVDDGWFHYLTAASVLLRCRALGDVGIFDEVFFLYWEDTDLGFRLRKHGWKLGVAPASVVLHKEHASTGRNRRKIDRYVFASGVHFLAKHSPVPWISIPLFLWLQVAKSIARGQLGRVADVGRGIGDYMIRRRLPDKGQEPQAR